MILDPCRGGGSFYDNLPSPKDWCEIDEGKDFYDYTSKVDWIISNPPYSHFDEWLDHSFALSDNVVYLVPIAKVWKSWGTMMVIKKYGGIKKVLFIPASRCGFPFGFPCGAVHLVRVIRVRWKLYMRQNSVLKEEKEECDRK